MTSFPSSAGGSYGYKDLRSLYPAISDNHLRYLEKWGLLTQSAVPRDRREYSFADLLTVRQVAAEIERGTPLRIVLRTLIADRQGQLEFDFNALHAAPDTPHPKVIALQARQAARQPTSPAMAGPIGPGSLQAPADPQAALAAKYFLEGSSLDDGDERKRIDGRGGLPEGAGARSVSRGGAHQPGQHPLPATSWSRRRRSTSARSASSPISSRRTSISATSIHDLGRFAEALVCYREALRAQPGVRRRALLPGGDVREDGAVAGRAAALARVSAARAATANGWSWRRSFRSKSSRIARISIRSSDACSL